MVLTCTLHKPYTERVPISVNPNATAVDPDTKFAAEELRISQDPRLREVNRSVTELTFSQLKPSDFKEPNKRGVMAEKDKLQKAFKPLPFHATTTSLAGFQVTSKMTKATYCKPYHMPHSEAAVKSKPTVLGRSYEPSSMQIDFGRYGDLPQDRKGQSTADLNLGTTKSGPYTPGYLGHKPRSEVNRQMVARLPSYGGQGLTKVDLASNTHKNLPGYTGFSPTESGPFRPGVETTSSRANFQGLGYTL